MEIRFISSLTAEDEEVFAPAVLKAACAFLDQLPEAVSAEGMEFEGGAPAASA